MSSWGIVCSLVASYTMLLSLDSFVFDNVLMSWWYSEDWYHPQNDRPGCGICVVDINEEN